jgi:hypothetical protein
VIHQGTSARGHFAGTPTRSLHARGAGAPGDNVRLPALGGIKPLAHRDARQPIAAPAACCPAPRPPAGGGRCAAGGRRQHSGTLASGHFVGTPARSLHARGAVVPSDHFRVRALGVITRFTPRRVRRRDRRRADGGAWRAEGAGIPGTSASGHFAGMPTRSLHARGADARGDTSGWPGWVAITRIPRPLPVPLRPPPDVRRRDRRPAKWGCAAGGRRSASTSVVARPLNRGANAQPARPSRG